MEKAEKYVANIFKRANIRMEHQTEHKLLYGLMAIYLMAMFKTMLEMACNSSTENNWDVSQKESMLMI